MKHKKQRAQCARQKLAYQLFREFMGRATPVEAKEYAKQYAEIAVGAADAFIGALAKAADRPRADFAHAALGAFARDTDADADTDTDTD